MQRTVNGDTPLDLVCKVETADFMIELDHSTAVLEAQGFGGTTICGEDVIQIMPG